MAQTRSFTDREMLRRVWDREKIQDVMARRAYYAANNQRGRELEELWVSGEAGKSAAYGKTWGYYIGLEAIRDYYVTRYDAALEAQLAAFRRANPGAAAEKGVGSAHFHPLSTPLIEIAGDGETAKGLWYSIGQRTELDEDGAPRAWWIAMKVGADFRREADGWRIWHLVEIYDVVNEDGTDYKEVPYCYPEGGPPHARRVRDAHAGHADP